jgi:hypothetical protein
VHQPLRRDDPPHPGRCAVLIRTDAYVAALTDVARQDVLYRSPGQPGGDTYIWRVGGLVPADEDRALHLLQVCRYIALVPAVVVDGDIACLVHLTEAGDRQLTAWAVAP